MADDSLSDEDKALFRQHMSSVKPLSTAKQRVSTPKTTPALPPRKHDTPRPVPPKKDVFLSDFISEAVLSESVLSYSHPSVATKQFRALKNGQIRWEGRLDLHGLYAETARDALCQFIHAQSQNNKRCLLIIHGKGGHQGAPPVIKNLVNRWLPQLDEVLAFHSALPKDGGYGAVYVLLKKINL